MAPSKLTLFLDVISPFGYMALHVLTTNPTFKQCNLEIVPIFLGGVMQSTGNRPPLTIQNKGAYLLRQRAQWCKRFNIPMADGQPTPFPQSTIQTGRALCAIKAEYPDKFVDACFALSNAMWRELKSVGKPEVIAAELEPIFGKEGVAKILELATQPEAKKQLIANTDLALEEGCFGLPYYLVTNSEGESETFWGFDALGQVVDHLGLERQGEGFRPML